MNRIIKLVIDYKESQTDFIFQDLVDELTDLIDYHKRKVAVYYRDDLGQELLVCLVRVIDKFRIKNFKPINEELFNLNTLKLLLGHNYNNVNDVLNNKYVLGFIDKYGADLFNKAFENLNDYNIFIFEFKLFCNENQFFKYLDKSLTNQVNHFVRENKINDNKIISLNSITSSDIEYIDLIPDIEEETKIVFDINLLDETDRSFLYNFIKDDEIITGKEVAEILGVTQQAVSKRLKRLYKRYLKKYYEVYEKVEK